MPRSPIAISLILLLSSCLKVPTAAEKGITFSTQPIQRKEGQMCISTAQQQKAREIMLGESFTVLLAAGQRPIPEDEWTDFRPGFGNVKNTERHLLFDRSCFLRSPDTPANCAQDNCLSFETIGGWTWAKLAKVEAIDCMPNSRYCNPSFVPASHLAAITILKCHEMEFSGSAYILSGPKGEKAIMHATADGHPSTDVHLPTGWKLEEKELSEPLIVQPFGTGNECYFTVLRDHKAQSYHMFQYSNKTWPPK